MSLRYNGSPRVLEQAVYHLARSAYQLRYKLSVLGWPQMYGVFGSIRLLNVTRFDFSARNHQPAVAWCGSINFKAGWTCSPQQPGVQRFLIEN